MSSALSTSWAAVGPTVKWVRLAWRSAQRTLPRLPNKAHAASKTAPNGSFGNNRAEMTETPIEAPSDSAAYVRLHVTPLDSDLLNVVLNPALLPKARNISYHTIETFPEKRYGFLELPNDDAEKLKKKLNGAVLRGAKIRIERAKPPSIPPPLGDAAMDAPKESKKRKDGDRKDKSKSKKRRRNDELVGSVIEEGRSVKRGWTTADEPKDKDKRSKKDKKDKDSKTKDKKQQPRSKYTEHAECLIKTVLPASASASTSAPTDADDPSFRKRKKNKSREVVIHEFEKTTKFPTFLKSTTLSGPDKAPLEFVDGKGWVDEGGNIVEAVKTRSGAVLGSASSKKAKAQAAETVSKSDGASSSDTDESTDDEELNENGRKVKSKAAAKATTPEQTQTNVGSPSPQRERSKSPVTASPTSLKPDPSRPKSSGSMRSLTIKIPPATPEEAKVHPLEALYKRPAQGAGSEDVEPADSKPFNFFNGDDGHSEEEEEVDETPRLQIPMTPYTRQDFESRGIRSAAPTPDTAHPNRRFWEQEDDIAEDDEDDDVDREVQQAKAEGAAEGSNPSEEQPGSDFQKWFWENRGDINRSWRKRRKTAGKEKRYRENKSRVARAI